MPASGSTAPLSRDGIMTRSVVIAGAGPLIALALQRQACGDRLLVILDDRCGRAEARRQGLPIIGTAAVLVLAKGRNLIPTCGPLRCSTKPAKAEGLQSLWELRLSPARRHLPAPLQNGPLPGQRRLPGLAAVA
jgi:hypothetical protein